MAEQISPKPPETPREELLSTACDFAQLLLRGKNVRRVGLYGSLARDKKYPSDIDLVVLVDDEAAIKFENENFIQAPDYPERLRQVLGFEKDDFPRVTEVLSRQADTNPISMKVISDRPSAGFVIYFTRHTLEPSFLQKVAETLLIFDPQKKSFKKVPVFSEEETALIQNITFQRLKKIVNDNRVLDEIYNSPGHQKKIRQHKTR